MRSGLVML
ncbi:hypothetical protein ACHAWT_000053 [Skeletonema menzelii]